MRLRPTEHVALLAILVSSMLLSGSLLLLETGASSTSLVESTSVGVYWDAGCTTPVQQIDWGTISPGSSKTVAAFVRNEGVSSVRFVLNTTNWQPPESSVKMLLGWNYSGRSVKPRVAVPIAFILSAGADAGGLTSFSFDIVVSASEYASYGIGDFASLFADNSRVRVVYPAARQDNPGVSKPLGCGFAELSDWTASAFVTTKLKGAVEGLDTDGRFVDQNTGGAVGDEGSGIVTFGGCFVNPITRYVEQDSTSPADRAPVRFHGDAQTCSFQRWDRSEIPSANLPWSVINHDKDMFVIEVFEDGGGRQLMVCYGIGWKGTYAAGKYFHEVVSPNLASYRFSWVVVKWVDSNGDGFVNGPSGGDAYTVVASGT